MPALPQQLFDLTSLGTFAGATAAVFVLVNTARMLTPVRTPWLAFGISLAVAFVGAQASGAAHGASTWFVTFLNGCLLFCTASGANELAASRRAPSPQAPQTPQTESGAPKRPPFVSSWFPRD